MMITVTLNVHVYFYTCNRTLQTTYRSEAIYVVVSNSHDFHPIISDLSLSIMFVSKWPPETCFYHVFEWV